MRARLLSILGLAIAILIAFGIGFSGTGPPVGEPAQSTTLPQTSSGPSSNLTSTSLSFPEPPCTKSVPTDVGPGYAPSFNIPENSSLLLCVEFFYYSSGGSLGFNPLQELAIRAENNSASGNSRYPPDTLFADVIGFGYAAN